MKASYTEAIERMKKKLGSLQEIHDKAYLYRHELEQKVENSSSEIQKRDTNTAFLNEKITGLKAKLEELRKSEEENRKVARDLKLEMVRLQSDNAVLNESGANRDQKLKETSSKLAALIDELWKRDNDILRRETHKIKLVEELNSLKSAVQHSQVRMKFKVAEEMTEVNSKLEEKDKEIHALKKLLQSRSGPAEAAKVVKENLSEKEITERLEEALRRLEAMKSSEGDELMRTKGFNVIRSLQADLKGYREVVLQKEGLQNTPNLSSLAGKLEGESVTVGDLIDQAVGLTA